LIPKIIETCSPTNRPSP